MYRSYYKSYRSGYYYRSGYNTEVHGYSVLACVIWRSSWLTRNLSFRHDLSRLKYLCEEKLVENTSLENVHTMASLATHHHCSRLEEAAVGLLGKAPCRAVLKCLAKEGLIQALVEKNEDELPMAIQQCKAALQ